MSVERIELGQVKHTKIEVEEVGRSVTIRDEAHAKANHFIKQSRQYFLHEKLPIYIDCPYFLKSCECSRYLEGKWWIGDYASRPLHRLLGVFDSLRPT